MIVGYLDLNGFEFRPRTNIPSDRPTLDLCGKEMLRSVPWMIRFATCTVRLSTTSIVDTEGTRSEISDACEIIEHRRPPSLKLTEISNHKHPPLNNLLHSD